MAKSGVKDKCPACGVPAKMFEPYVEHMSPFRKRILKLDLHPIMVHFTQAFTATIPVLCLLALTGPLRMQAGIQATIGVLGIALPFVVLFSFLAGLLDGKIRFRRVTTPLLKTKVLFSLTLFLLSCGIMLITRLRLRVDHAALVNILALGIPAAGCSSYLGLLGVRMLNAAFPG